MNKTKYVELSVEDFWTRVRSPPPPPYTIALLIGNAQKSPQTQRFVGFFCPFSFVVNRALSFRFVDSNGIFNGTKNTDTVKIMARIVTPLSPAKILVTKPKERLCKLSDSSSLALWVFPNGRKTWRFEYRRKDKN